MHKLPFPRTPKRLWLSVKVTEEQKINIRRLAAEGLGRMEIGRILGMPEGRVRRWMLSDIDRKAHDKGRMPYALEWAKKYPEKVRRSSKKYRIRKRVVLCGRFQEYVLNMSQRWMRDNPARFKAYHWAYEQTPKYKKLKAAWEMRNKERRAEYHAKAFKRKWKDPVYRAKRREWKRKWLERKKEAGVMISRQRFKRKGGRHVKV